MEGVDLDYLKNDRIVKKVNPKYAFYSYLIGSNKKGAPDAHTHMMNIHQNFMDEYMIK